MIHFQIESLNSSWRMRTARIENTIKKAIETKILNEPDNINILDINLL